MFRKSFLLCSILILFSMGGVTEFSYTQKNSIRVHPYNLVSAFVIEDGHYFFEADYTRSLPKNWDLVCRVSRFVFDPSAMDFDGTGDWRETEFELGARKLFHLAGNENIRFSLFPQVSLAGGYVDYYRIDDSNELTAYSGNYGRVYCIGGFQFYIERFVLSADCGVGLGLCVPSEEERWKIEPNFTTGLTF
ncbi:MAG: hypothetical protein ACQEQV_06765 [Fibrobacterota bacterium]